MTDLQDRLDSIQDQILDLYEKNSTDLSDHEKFYLLSRREHAILFLARQKGTKLSMPLPSLAASKSRARDAIEMSLLVGSLKNSPFGSETWSLQEVSRERLNAPPAQTFKKGGGPVQVQFGDNPENVMEYTVWDFVYYQDDNEQWFKASGGVDLDGIYYTDAADEKVYFISFSEEAEKFHTPGKWSLLFDNNALAFVGSPQQVSSETFGRERSSSTSSSTTSHTASPSRTSRSSRSRRPRARSYRSRSRSRSRSGSRGTGSFSSSRSRSSTPRRRPANRVSRGANSPSPDLRRRRVSTSPGPHTRSQTPSPSLARGSATPERRGRSVRPRGLDSGGGPQPLDPEQVGSSRKTVQRRASGRLGELLAEARDPPGIVLCGPPNTLKCYRYQLKKSHASKFKLISTTWKWTEASNITRVGGGGRIILLFDSEGQRAQFLKSVHLPKAITAYTVSFNGI